MQAIHVRLVAVLAAFAVAVAPSLSEAKGFGRGGGKKSGSSSSSSSSSSTPSSSGSSSGGGFGRGNGSSSRGARASSPGPSYRTSDGGGYYRSRPAYSYGYGGYYEPGYVPYYSTWGVYPYGYYAYGYHPYWGAPPMGEAPAGPSDTTVSLSVGGFVDRHSPAAPGATLVVDGARWGFNLQSFVLASEGDGGFDAMPLTSAHVAYSLIADPHARVRFELGATAVNGVGVLYVGPDLGLSAQLALVGPFALEGAAHLTPMPARILDLEAAVALHFGALGVKGGWRVVRLDDTHTDHLQTGVDLFSGPQVSVGVVF